MNYGHRAKLLLTMLSFFIFIVYANAATLLGPSIPSMVTDFKADLGAIGVFATFYSLGALSSVIAGILSDRHGALSTIAFGTVLLTLGVWTIAISPSLLSCYVSFLVAGTAAGFIEASLNSIIIALYPKNQGLMMNVLHSFWGAGALVGPMLAAYSISSTGTWRTAYGFSALMLVPFNIAFLFALRMRKGFRMKQEVGRAKPRIVLSSRTTVLLSSVAFSYVGCELGINVWLPTYLMEAREFSLLDAGLVLGLFWALMGVGRPIWGRAVDKLGYRIMTISTSAMATLLILVAFNVTSRPMMFLLWPAVGFFLAPVLPVVIVWACSFYPSDAGLISGFLFSVGTAGSVVASTLLGLMANMLPIKTFIYGLVPFSMATVALSILTPVEKD